jgi:hypothetical protein
MLDYLKEAKAGPSILHSLNVGLIPIYVYPPLFVNPYHIEIYIHPSVNIIMIV